MEQQTYIGTYQGREPDGHVLVAPDGSRFVLKPTTILDSRLADVPVGVKVKVEKTGRTVATKGGKKADEYVVFVAKGSHDVLRRAIVSLLGFGTPEESPPVPDPDDPAK